MDNCQAVYLVTESSQRNDRNAKVIAGKGIIPFYRVDDNENGDAGLILPVDGMALDDGNVDGRRRVRDVDRRSQTSGIWIACEIFLLPEQIFEFVNLGNLNQWVQPSYSAD